MAKPILKPKMYCAKEVYADFVGRLLAKNPGWWGKYNKTLKIKNGYIYDKQGDKIILKMSWQIWKEITERFFHKAKERIIQGETLRMGCGIGIIRAVRIERNFSNPKVNWHASLKKENRNEDGSYNKIYFTDDDYCRIQWAKMGWITNEMCYQFTPAAQNMTTRKGFKAEFKQALREDPLLKYNFKYYPIIRNNTELCNTPTAACGK